MANVFVDANEVFPIAGSADVFGRQGGNEGVVIQSGVTGVNLDANLEQIELAQNSSELDFAVTGDGLEIQRDGTTVANVASLNQDADVRLTDGNLTIRQTASSTFEVEGGDGTTETVNQGETLPVQVPLGNDTANVRVPESTLSITSKSGTIESADSIDIELGGQTATVDFSGNQDASGVASTIASQVSSLSNVAAASASNQTITFQAAGNGSVAIGSITETDANDSFTIETDLGGTDTSGGDTSDGSGDDTSGGDGDDTSGGSGDDTSGGSSDGGADDPVAQSSLTITSKSGAIEADDSIDITLGGQTANVNFSGDQDASGVASTIASQVTSLNNVASASADSQTVTFNAVEGGDVSIDDVSETDANDSFNIETDFDGTTTSALMPAQEPMSTNTATSGLTADGLELA